MAGEKVGLGQDGCAEKKPRGEAGGDSLCMDKIGERKTQQAGVYI